jgi:hypothetical protein
MKIANDIQFLASLGELQLSKRNSLGNAIEALVMGKSIAVSVG